MPEHLKPESPDHVRDAVRWAAENKTPIELIGHGSKRAIGRPSNAAHTLDVSTLSGISLYEPAELVLSAGAGTALSEIEDTVAANGQQLAFEPPDLSHLLGHANGKGTWAAILHATCPVRGGSKRARRGIISWDSKRSRGAAMTINPVGGS